MKQLKEYEEFEQCLNLAGRNNPCGAKEPDRDATDRGGIIPEVKKSQIEMQLTGRNNPCRAKEPDRDASDRGEIIPVEQKSQIEMHLTGRNNP